MTLENYIKQLQEIVEQNPDYKKLTVIYATDDEGNDFKGIGFAPSLGNYNHGSFTQQENFDEIDDDDQYVNVICIN